MGVRKGKRTDMRNRIHTLSVWLVWKSVVLFCILLGVACGKVGPPIYPEEIGLAVKLEENRLQKTSGTEKSEPRISQDVDEPQNAHDRVPQEGDVLLPPLRPFGSQ